MCVTGGSVSRLPLSSTAHSAAQHTERWCLCHHRLLLVLVVLWCFIAPHQHSGVSAERCSPDSTAYIVFLLATACVCVCVLFLVHVATHQQQLLWQFS